MDRGERRSLDLPQRRAGSMDLIRPPPPPPSPPRAAAASAAAPAAPGSGAGGEPRRRRSRSFGNLLSSAGPAAGEEARAVSLEAGGHAAGGSAGAGAAAWRPVASLRRS